MNFRHWFAATIFAPFFVMSADIGLLHYFNPNPPAVFYIGLGLSVIAGVYCLWRLPTSIKKRALLTIIFVPVSIAVLIFYLPWFEGAILGDGI